MTDPTVAFADPILAPRPGDRVGPFVLGSAVAHAVLAAILVAWGALEPDVTPMINPDDAMLVSLAAPRSPDALPHRAERAPAPPPAAPEAVKAPTPPPPNPSDLSVKTPDAPATPKAPTAAELEARRRALLADLDDDAPADAPDGTTNRSASTPDGVDGPAGSGSAVLGDPEYARYIATLRGLFMGAFRPLPALRGQGLVTRVVVTADASGRVTGARVGHSSGNPSWDQAALAAAYAVPSIPLPPERFRARLAGGYTLEFADGP